MLKQIHILLNGQGWRFFLLVSIGLFLYIGGQIKQVEANDNTIVDGDETHTAEVAAGPVDNTEIAVEETLLIADETELSPVTAEDAPHPESRDDTLAAAESTETPNCSIMWLVLEDEEDNAP